MKFITAAVATLMAASGALAAPGGWGDWQPSGPKCLSQDDANSIVAQFESILEHTDVAAANATAQSLLTDDYTEVSDSILSLEGLPLGTDTFVGKQYYIEGVLNSPGVEGIHDIKILVAGCTQVLWYWNFTGIGTRQYEIKGFNLFTITDNLQISKTELEFNSIAWGLDTGYQIIFPPPQ